MVRRSSPSTIRAGILASTILALLITSAPTAAKNLLEVIKDGSDRFSTLLQAIDTAGLGDTLQKGGPFTVFAPTNDAFNLLPNGTLAKLMATPDDLKKTLIGHIVNGSYPIKSLVNNQVLPTLDGQSNTIVIADNVTMKVDGANIIVSASDMMADNGVVHAIDRVLNA